jgi:D-glycero-beta-D-manno-heptose 1-phosphate adenylyltransferase
VESSTLRTSSKILPAEEAIQVANALKRLGLRVVFTNGCFDLLHPGHTHYLAEARKQGDRLLVAINSDGSIREIKGAGRPVFPAPERAEILAALEAVDYVTIFDDPTPLDLIVRIMPQVLVKGGDWGADQIVGKAEVEGSGGRVVSIPVVAGYSTSALIRRALEPGL